MLPPAEPGQPLPPGTVVATRWRLERPIGKGGMSEVHAAVDLQGGPSVALKTAWPRGLMSPDEFVARFRREVEIGRRLGKDPAAFVRVSDWGPLPDGGLFLVMDLVDGARDLDLLTGTRPERLRRLAHAAWLVARAHALGVVHRDVKPTNFLVGPDGATRLGDFGIAKLVGREQTDAPLAGVTATGTQLGSLAFMAPEQLDAKRAGPAADVYSLGVMLFLALAGRAPFLGRRSEHLTRLRCLEQGLARPPSPARLDPTIPTELDALCVRCLEGDPARRPTAAQLADALRPYALGQTPAVKVSGVQRVVARPPRTTRRRPPG